MGRLEVLRATLDRFQGAGSDDISICISPEFYIGPKAFRSGFRTEINQIVI